jgi:small-conductance mechanosensitive channel
MKKKSADLISRITQYMKDNPTVANWINLMVSIIIAVIIVLILLKIERKITRKWIDKHDGINARFTEKLVRCVIIFLAILWVIMSNSLTQSFGSTLFQGTAVLAAIAGFAAKPVLSDMLCGFMISTTKPFNIGDRIELDDGTAGIVKDITIRHVVLQGIDTLKIVIPNSEINARRITNMSHMTKTRSIHFRFTVGLNTRTDEAKRVIQEAIAECPWSLPRVGEDYSPVYFLNFTDNGLLMATTVYYAPTSPTEVVKDDINCRVKRALEAANIEIPYNYMNVINVES